MKKVALGLRKRKQLAFKKKKKQPLTYTNTQNLRKERAVRTGHIGIKKRKDFC